MRRRTGVIVALAGVLACSSEEPSAGSPSEATTGTGDDQRSDHDRPSDHPRECVPAAFVHAPAPVEVDGLTAVPIDILELDAELSFDAAAASAYAHGTLTFQLGEAGGMPIFDLRQTPDTLRLDGKTLPGSALARHDFGAGGDAGFLILEVTLAPCSVHRLEFGHSLGVPQAPLAVGPSYGQAPARVHFDLFASDLNAGRFLESWLPANMPWDRHPISLSVTLEHAEIPHALIGNGVVDEIGPHQWQLEFPATTTALDPMVVLLPSDAIDSQTGVHRAANGQAIPFAIHVDTQVGTSAAVIATQVAAHLDELVASLGPYPHPELTVYIHPSSRSMEYAGATTSNLGSLEHEIFHSWWARGLSPANYADGWIDEGWDMFNTGSHAFVPAPLLTADAGPWQLHDPHPFARKTPDDAYDEGRKVFAGLAEIMGVEPLRAAMNELYAELGPLGSIATAQLERALFCASGERLEVRQLFHRFVHGLDGDAAPVADGYCR